LENYFVFDIQKFYQIINYDRAPLCIEKHYPQKAFKLILGEENQKSNNSMFSFELVEHNYYKIKVFHSNLYLEVYGDSVDENVIIIQNESNEKTS
jgi:hypothetical protein